jgi:hypothetical protein
MVHRKAPLTQFGRLPLVQRSIELGWHRARPPRPWAVSRATAYQLAGPLPRPGPAGWPTAAPDLTAACTPYPLPGPRVLATRRRHRQGPHRLAWRLHLFRSTIYGGCAAIT